MAFQLKADESVRRGLRRLSRKEIRSAADALKKSRNRDDAIHEARRSLKKVRAILEIFRNDDGKGLGKQRRRLRNASRSLSELRDAGVRVDMFDALRRRVPAAMSKHAFTIVRRELVNDKKQAMNDADVERTFADVAKTLDRAERSAKGWRSRHRKFPAVARAIRAAQREGRSAMRRARTTERAADFHEWRKAAKRLWYELRLLEASGPGIRGDIRALKEVETWLGDDHNIVVLCARLFNDRALAQACDQFSQLREAADRYQHELRRKALARARNIYDVPAGRYVGRLKRSWRDWRRTKTAA